MGAQPDPESSSDDGLAQLSVWTAANVVPKKSKPARSTAPINITSSDDADEEDEEEDEQEEHDEEDKEEEDDKQAEQTEHVEEEGVERDKSDNDSGRDETDDTLGAQPSIASSSKIPSDNVEVIIPPYNDNLSDYDDYTRPDRTVVEIFDSFKVDGVELFTVTFENGDSYSVSFLSTVTQSSLTCPAAVGHFTFIFQSHKR